MAVVFFVRVDRVEAEFIVLVYLIYIRKPQTALIHMAIRPIRHLWTEQGLHDIGRIVQANMPVDVNISAGVDPRTVFLVLLVESESFQGTDDEGMRRMRAALMRKLKWLNVMSTGLILISF